MYVELKIPVHSNIKLISLYIICYFKNTCTNRNHVSVYISSLGDIDFSQYTITLIAENVIMYYFALTLFGPSVCQSSCLHFCHKVCLLR